MDWVKWHERYDALPKMQIRLAVVRKHILGCLNSRPAGQIKVISVCSGDGRDLIGLAKSHSRMEDVRALLVDNNAELVRSGSAQAIAAGLEEQIRFSLADATNPAAYTDFAPADLVLVVGVFGNLQETEIEKFIGNLNFLCQRQANVIWTRDRKLNDGTKRIDQIRSLFREHHFEEVTVEDTSDNEFTVGTHVFVGDTVSPPAVTQFFQFTDYDQIQST